MIKEFERLTSDERTLLYNAPVFVSVLVSCSPDGINQTQKNDALRLAHLRTFTAPPLLLAYYREVEKIFPEEYEKAVKKYAPFSEEKRTELKQELDKANKLIAKLEPGYAAALYKSLESYARHVKTSANSVFQDFIFPIAYSRLNH